MAYHAPGSAANAPAPVGAGTVTRMTLDEFGALKIRAAEERRCAAPPELDLATPAGHLRRFGFDGSREAIRSRPSTFVS
jgi:hypothetical protein